MRLVHQGAGKDHTDLCNVWVYLPLRPEEHDYLMFYNGESVYDEV